jgi:UDP-N-acetylmuramyl pentapeptide phosphotransferase/UDP-N-acetylglucosamine-1-phosphate transferase
MNYFLSFIISAAAALYFLPVFFELLSEKRIVRLNYSGKTLVSSMGLAMLFTCLVGVLPFSLVKNMDKSVIYVAAVALTGFLGFMDDMLADTGIKGIKAHLSAAGTGKSSVGWLKILIGIGTGFIVSAYFHLNWLVWPLYTLLFALSMNFINILDLRPGRAVKGFLLNFLVITVLVGFGSVWIFIPVFTFLLAYIGGELKEIYMMGDTGANLLGGIIGLYAVWELNMVEASVFLGVYLFIHIFAEYRSISGYIESNRLLNFIDCIGRLKDERGEAGAG